MKPVTLAGMLSCLMATACGGGSATATPTPTAPTPAPIVSIQSVRVTPEGVGLQHGTDFQFAASGSFPTGTQFTWQFGDGSSITTSTATATHTYAQTGNFGATVEARSGPSSATFTSQLSVRSMVGRWRGSVTGHTRLRTIRGVVVGPPLTSFDLTVATVGSPGGSGSALRFSELTGAWSDNVGCNSFTGNPIGPVLYLQQLYPRQGVAYGGTVWGPLGVVLNVPGHLCNDAVDFELRGTADSTINRVEGSCAPFGCPSGAATCNCQFQMTRQ